MLIRKVEKFLREHDMAATKFGRLAAHDPRFVLDLRMGRIPRPATEKRTEQWMEQYEAAPEKIALPGNLSPATPAFESHGLEDHRPDPLEPAPNETAPTETQPCETPPYETKDFTLETKGYAHV